MITWFTNAYLEVRRLFSEERGPTTTQWILLVAGLVVFVIGVYLAFRGALGDVARYFLDILDNYRPPQWTR